jgi:hypothetical protein
MNHKIDVRKPWQKTRWAQVLAIVLGYALPLLVFFVQLEDGEASAEGYLLYAGVYTLCVIAVQLLVLWWVCGEKPRTLNLKPGTWWKDLAGGLVLVGLTFSLKLILDPVFAKFFYRASDSESGLGSLFSTLAADPWLLALFLGPILFIGVAGSEELTRVFFITRWKNISSSKVWLGVGVFLSAALFGLNHIAQGPAGIISVSLNGLVMALWYLRFGRIFHLVVAHYLYDAVQIIFVVNLIWRGVL